MKQIFITIFIIGLSQALLAQDVNQQEIRQVDRSETHQLNVENTHNYQSEFNVGGRLNTNGWSVYLELEKRHNDKISNIFQFEVGETKHPKENKVARSTGLTVGPWGNLYRSSARPFVYGKKNVFYQIRLGYGQRRTIGTKGIKNGVEVSAIYMGGIVLGLVKPYYLQLVDSTTGSYYAKYTPETELDFLNPNNIISGGGFKRGWDELEINPGLYARVGMRFDWAEFNEFVSAIEVGVTGSFYTKEVQIMANNEGSKFFYGAYVSLLFGKRW